MNRFATWLSTLSRLFLPLETQDIPYNITFIWGVLKCYDGPNLYNYLRKQAAEKTYQSTCRKNHYSRHSFQKFQCCPCLNKHVLINSYIHKIGGTLDRLDRLKVVGGFKMICLFCMKLYYRGTSEMPFSLSAGRRLESQIKEPAQRDKNLQRRKFYSRSG